MCIHLSKIEDTHVELYEDTHVELYECVHMSGALAVQCSTNHE